MESGRRMRSPSAAVKSGCAAQDQGAGPVAAQAQDAVEAEGLVVAGRVVHEVEDDEALLAGRLAGAPAELLEVDDLRERRAGHEQHLDVGAVPALV